MRKLGLLAICLVVSTACGNKAPPETAHADTEAGTDPSPATTTPASTPDAGATPTASASTPASAAASTPPTPTTLTPEPVDECTPVGVDFEKRARPKLRDCYKEGKKKDPNLEGSVKISVDVSTLGKISSIKITDKTLPDPVAQCMLKAVKALPFPEASKCPGKGITIPITFPTPH